MKTCRVVGSLPCMIQKTTAYLFQNFLNFVLKTCKNTYDIYLSDRPCTEIFPPQHSAKCGFTAPAMGIPQSRPPEKTIRTSLCQRTAQPDSSATRSLLEIFRRTGRMIEEQFSMQTTKTALSILSFKKQNKTLQVSQIISIFAALKNWLVTYKPLIRFFTCIFLYFCIKIFLYGFTVPGSIMIPIPCNQGLNNISAFLYFMTN